MIRIQYIKEGHIESNYFMEALRTFQGELHLFKWNTLFLNPESNNIKCRELSKTL